MAFQHTSISVSWLVILFLVAVLTNIKTAASYKVEVLPDSYAHLNEGPHWDVATQSLYFVNLEAGVLRRLDYKQDKIYQCQIENATFASFIIPIEGYTDKFAVGIEHNVAVVKWDGVSEICKVEKNVLTVEQNQSKYKNNRFNDAKCDPLGRLFAGTMQKSDYTLRTGNLYMSKEAHVYKRLVSNLAISNGLAFNAKAKKFYLIDSYDFNVKAFDYDIKTGEIKNPKVIFELEGGGPNLLPDGMTIDSEGFLYVAINGGSAIYKIDPTNGKVVLEIKIPSKQVTSAAFGGPNLNILYVTLADETSSSGKAQSYRVTDLGAKGLPMTKLKIKI